MNAAKVSTKKLFKSGVKTGIQMRQTNLVYKTKINKWEILLLDGFTTDVLVNINQMD